MDQDIKPDPVGKRTKRQKMTSYFKMLRRFSVAEDGAVTVDWVVLTAAVCGLVGLAMAGMRGNMTSVGQKAGDFLSSTPINTTFN